MSVQRDRSDPEVVGRVLDVVDLVADQYDVDAEAVLSDALACVQERGGDGE